MKYLTSGFLAISLLQSCVITGLTNDYSMLTPAQKELIHTFKNVEKLEPRKIYKINALQLKEEIKKHPKSIVYVFTSGCSSPTCLPLNSYELYAQKHGYKLFMVMTGYNDLEQSLSQKFESPLFVIDNEYYNEQYRHIYTRYFTNELLGYPINTKYKERELRGNLFFYENGRIRDVLIELPD